MKTQKVDLAGRRKRLMTGEEYGALGDIGSSELVRGKVVKLKSAYFEHGKVELKVGRLIDLFVRERGLGEVAVGEVGVYTACCPDTVRGADVVFLSNERLARHRSGFLHVAPELVVEVHGAKASRSRLQRKIIEYFACGVLMVWVVEPSRKRVIVYRSPADSRELGPGDDLTGGDVLPGFRVKMADLW
ncbi:MAG: Uma2 family endonuclease [Planctomycetes bacterium]|nr:Uma2 family endonuclease [Planctomycetota bacterium]